MESIQLPLIYLDLRQPLFYTKTSFLGTHLPLQIPENGEVLLCYELNPAQSRNIEPNRELLLGNLVFAGQKNHETQQTTTEEEVFLPQGHYLLVQYRADKALEQEKWLDMAIEQQKDGLWEQHKPGNLLYVRFLYEDGAFVTQVFRQV